MARNVERGERGRWLPGTSGNPSGGNSFKRRGESIAAILRDRFDARAVIDRLNAMALGEVPDCPFICQVAAARLLLAYDIGLPTRTIEKDGRLQVEVCYVDLPGPTGTPGVIDVDTIRQLPSAENQE